MATPADVTLKKLIIIPAAITLAVTLLRLAGELLHWSPSFFSREAGGAGAVVGIVWLVPIFGVRFALTLSKAGQRPPGTASALGYSILGFAMLPVVGFLATKLGLSAQSFATFALYVVVSVLGGIVAFRGWPALGRALFAYGLAARVPVAIVMLFAILGNWGTHYDIAPPGFPEMSAISKWLLIGVLPQLTFWMWFTIAAGGIFGAIAVALAGRTRRPVPA